MSTQRQKIVLAILLAVMAVVYLRAWRPSQPSSPPTAQPQPVEAAPASPIEAQERRRDVPAERAAQRQRAGELAWGRDPFLRGGTEGASGLVLSGILWDAQAPVAILNGQMLRVGEELEGFRITRIAADAVTVTDGAETFQLQIAP